jgi:hypothetical protein
MTAIHIASDLPDEKRRRLLYDGDLAVVPPTPSSLALAAFARDLIAEAFAPHDPLTAQRFLDVEAWVGRFAPLKPRFIHHPRTAELIAQILVEVGCDPDDVYWDVPRLRGVTSDAYLTAGVGYAHHPHRDTWYAAPQSQLNWWMPLYPFQRESAMAFHCDYFARSLENSSSEFDYYRWNDEGRRHAAEHVHTDTRRQPKATDSVALEPEVRVVSEVGSMLVFSAAQLHSTVPNTTGSTRFSLDFRTVSVSDLEAGVGAHNWDSKSTGTSLRDFHRTSDRTSMPTQLVERFDSGDGSGSFVFVADAT